MKTFNTQTVAKPGFTKSKAFGLCGTLAIATALLIGSGTVSADETTQPVADTQPAVANVYTADNAGNVTVTPSETVAEAPKVLAPAPVESQPLAETPAVATETAPAAPTSVVKNGDTITVENPNVQVDFPNGNGKYSPFEVEYKDIEFPDSMPINEGDKVVTELPKEIGLQTSFDFDVYNNENIVGKANADAQARKITTTFNNYFTGHPLNKKMSLKFDAKWLDIVEPGKPVTVNFNGTVKTFEIADGNPIPTDELLSKWGWQDKNDPQIINWTLRLNTARKVLNNAILSDTWSNNQQFVDGSQNIYFVEDPLDWTVIDHSAKDYLESWNVRADGFDAKFKEFNRIMYIGYQTRLKSAVKDSTNPTNKATLTADDSSSKSTSKVQLVGGRGDASGENKPEPTFEIPHDAPKVEIPEWNGGVTPPDAPKYDKPEFNGGVVPNEAPIYDKPSIDINDVPLVPPAPVVEIPEWHGGTTPFDAPSIDKPEWSGGVVPFDAPILDKPELIIEIPEESVKPTTPSENTPSKPVDAPKTKGVETTTVSYNFDSEPKEVANTPVYSGTLPNTGEKEGIASTFGLVVIAAGITGLTLGFKKRNESED
ncbi:MAG: cell-wall agglutinin N-terminal ligand-sugar binding [Bacteriophage sp.]|nr:MAG: cell-wall agglutinin N-terminal ligand-sugar binding [Bacteriophage sp.]